MNPRNLLVKLILAALSGLTAAVTFDKHDPCLSMQGADFETTEIPVKQFCTGDNATEGCNAAFKEDIMKHFHPDLAIQNLSTPLCIVLEYFGQPGRELYGSTAAPAPEKLPQPEPWCAVSATYMDKETKKREKMHVKFLNFLGKIAAKVFYKSKIPLHSE
uniref:Secreted protein n=1 Tax=Cacopsylla melanoneura TaxID=428564 RepID=A0A8D8QYW3_9HEMI